MAAVPPRRAIWDVAHLAGLSTAPRLILVVSEYTSYILHNLAAADVWDHWRWALAPPEGGIYSPVVEDSAEWSLVQEVAEAFQTEMVEVGTVPISFIESVASEYYTATANAAVFTKTFSTVPDNECWEVEAWMMKASTAITLGEVECLVQGGYFARYPSPGVNIEQFTLARVTLGPGAALRFAWSGCTPNVTVVVARYNYRVLPLG